MAGTLLRACHLASAMTEFPGTTEVEPRRGGHTAPTTQPVDLLIMDCGQRSPRTPPCMYIIEKSEMSRKTVKGEVALAPGT